MMWRRLLVLDLVLVIVLVAGVLRVRQSWMEFEVTHRVESVKAEAETARTLPAANPAAAASEDWTEISVKDPFSFDRNDVSIIAPKLSAPTEPKPILFGTMSIGNEWVAMLGAGPAGNRSSRPMKVGESIGAWEVVEIHDKSAVVAGNGIRATVVMDDPLAQAPRDYSRTLSTSAPQQPVTVVNQPAAAPPPAANTPAPPGAPQAQPPAGESKPRILHTPFGDVPQTDPK
jgi:hypothetical protein